MVRFDILLLAAHSLDADVAWESTLERINEQPGLAPHAVLDVEEHVEDRQLRVRRRRASRDIKQRPANNVLQHGNDSAIGTPVRHSTVSPRMLQSAASIVSCAVLLLATTTEVAAAFSGKATTYGTNDFSGGACSVRQSPTGVTPSYFVAMNKQQYQNACGRCISIKGAKATVTAFVADLCNECGQNNLDLSGNLWTAVTGKTPGIEKITWDFVACPNPKPALCLKEGSNTYWLAVQAANVRDGVKQLQIAGQTGTMIGTTAFYYVNANGAVNLSKVPVTVTSIGGQKTSYTASLKVNQCTTV